MKKLLLSVMAVASLFLATNAATYMRVKTADGNVSEFDVENVTEVDYVVKEKVTEPAVEATTTGFNYVILSDDEVSISGITIGKKNMVIPPYVKIGGLTYKVVDVENKVFSNEGNGLDYLESLTLPGTFESIRESFTSKTGLRKCCNLKSLVISEGTKVIEDNALDMPHDSCEVNYTLPSTLIKFDYLNTEGQIIVNTPDGVLYNEDKTNLLLCGSNVKDGYKIPSTVKVVSYLAFEHCPDGMQVTIPLSVDSFYPLSFYGADIIMEYAKEQSGTEYDHDYVDLGLPSGTLWATCNVGASKPTEYGDKFAWGETKPKEDSYNCGPKCKYCTDSLWGTVDNKTVLEAEDDAATANWGSAWRMPTLEEMVELLDACSFAYGEKDGVEGVYGRSKKNGNVIFLPAGSYWSSSLYENRPVEAHSLLSSLTAGRNHVERYYGLSVRAVLIQGEYNVNFYDKDGKLIESQRIDAGKSATEVKAPIVDGYEFIGWNDSSFVNVTRNVEAHAVYVKQLPDLYVDVEIGDSVVFRQDGKTGYFIVEEATTAEVKLKVFYGGKSNVVTLSDSYGSFCSAGLQMVNLSSAVNNPSQIVFAKVAKLARIQSPNSCANSTVSSSAPETRFEHHAFVTVSGKEGNYTYVDLGLPSGTKWATYNVGASKPTEYGDYFAWGETKPKEAYRVSNYKWGKGVFNVDKYCTDNNYGTVDNKTVLEAEDDAANANWGSAWRMPTKEEIAELIGGCSWMWVEDFRGIGVNGRLGTSRVNGATIFLPAAGYRYDTDLNYAGDYGYYWSSSLYESLSYNAYCLNFNDFNIYRDYYYGRYDGQSVRAVLR